MKYYIKTFGCQMNYADSEKINMILLQSGLQKVLDPTKADIVILNTCSVRKKWEDRVFGFAEEIYDFNRKNKTNILVGMTGCMVRKTGIHRQYYEPTRKRIATRKIEILPITSDDTSFLNSDDKIFGISERFDFVFRIEDIPYLTKILSIIWKKEIGNDAKYNDYLQSQQYRENPASANIIIQTGCDNYCSYCIVPFTRGWEISRDFDDIMWEIQETVKSGAREVTLLWQNVNSYGKLTKKKFWNETELTWTSSEVKTPFRELLEKIDKIPWLDRIRFTSSNPHDMTKDILDAHFNLDHTCNYLHFALQSGSDNVLKNMNRKHTFIDFKSQVKYLRSKDPLFAISTDIIVGFPEETEADFQATIRAFEECEFDFAYIARYSPRPGTISADKKTDDIPFKEKARRWDILNTILQKSVTKRSKLMIGRIEEILISGTGKKWTLSGRTRNFKEVFIDELPNIKIGDIVKVHITELDRWVLKGKVI